VLSPIPKVNDWIVERNGNKSHWQPLARRVTSTIHLYGMAMARNVAGGRRQPGRKGNKSRRANTGFLGRCGLATMSELLEYAALCQNVTSRGTRIATVTRLCASMKSSCDAKDAWACYLIRIVQSGPGRAERENNRFLRIHSRGSTSCSTHCCSTSPPGTAHFYSRGPAVLPPSPPFCYGGRFRCIG
jgi:hypothetical protein